MPSPTGTKSGNWLARNSGAKIGPAAKIASTTSTANHLFAARVWACGHFSTDTRSNCILLAHLARFPPHAWQQCQFSAQTNVLAASKAQADFFGNVKNQRHNVAACIFAFPFATIKYSAQSMQSGKKPKQHRRSQIITIKLNCLPHEDN